MADELWNIGLVASNRDQIDCARYFEDIDNLEKAVILYHRAGMLHKALDLAFKSNQYDILQQIATDLDADSDPALVQKCADYFVNNEQFDKAVDLLAVGKKVLVDLSSLFGSCSYLNVFQFQEAISLCTTHNVQLTEDLATKLTPEKDQMDEEARNQILETLADSLMQQGSYHQAAQKFTQSGDKVFKYLYCQLKFP